MDQEFANKVKLEWEMEQISKNMSNTDNIIYIQLIELQNQNQQLFERMTKAETRIENIYNGGGSAASLIDIEEIINDPEEFAKRFFLTFMPKTDNVIYDKNYNVYVPQQIGLYVNYIGSKTSQQFMSLNYLRDFINDINDKSEFVDMNVYIFKKTQYIAKEGFIDFSHTEQYKQLELTDDSENVEMININESTDEQLLIELNKNTGENIYDWIYFELCVEIKIINDTTQEETLNKYFVDFKTTNFRVGNVEDYDNDES